MANRYWILGTGTWDATNTVNWSDSSGGLGGFSVPTAADNVFFDANSNVGTTAFTVTMATTPRVCNDFTASGLDGVMTLAGTSIGLTVSGSLTFQATNFTRTYTGVTTFNATTTGKTVTTNGVAFGGAITFDGVGGGWTLNSALTTSTASTTTLTNGALDIQSYTLSTGLFISTNLNTRTIAFGTGQISCTGTGTLWNTTQTGGLTITGAKLVNVTSVGSTAITVNPGSLSETDSISFNFTGGTYPLTFLAVATRSARNIDFTGYAGTWGVTSTGVIYGNLKLSTGMTLTASTNSMTFASTSGTQQITTNAKTIDFPLTFDGVGGTFQLQDALTMGSSRTATLTNGTLDLFGKTLTVGTAFTTATGTKNLTFNGGTLVCPTAATTAFNNAAPTNFTTTAGTGTGTISMTAATAKTFVGGGSTFNCTLNQGGAGALTITGSNTFSNITNTVQPASVLFTAATTSTFTNFSLSGTAGNLITIGSVTAASHTLSKASGTVSADYLSISRSTATGGAGWYAGANSTNGGSNSGWIFTAPPGGGYTIAANNGSYTVTGQSVTLLRSKILTGAYGSYAVTGQSATLLRSKALSGAYGVYTITGQTASLLRSKVLSANNGSYAVTGQSATLLRSKALSGDYGVYAVTGQSATLSKGRFLLGDSGTYGVTGQNAVITYGSVTINTDQLLVKLRSFTERRRF